MEITVQNAGKIINKKVILENVNLRWHGGMVYGLQGTNGSGKTMLLRLIAGLIRPTSGYVSVDGKKLGEDMDFPGSMGLLLENPAFLPGYTGYKNLELLASIQGKADGEQIRKTVLDVGLAPEDKRKDRKYSLGMKQRLGIAAAIMEAPDLILLDEPTNALDADGVEEICRLIRRERDRGALVVVACHDGGILKKVSDEIYTVVSGAVEKQTEVSGA